jgi:cbb3-type cytochrome oxidase subunit 3
LPLRKGHFVVPTEAVPPTVRIAGALTTLQAVVGFAYVVALLIRGASVGLPSVGALNRGETYGEAGYYGLLSAAVLAVGLGLWRGKHWARTPALLLQLLLIGAAWYAFGPSGQPLIGLVIGVPSVAVIWFLFNRAGRAWSFRAGTAPDAERD